MANWLHHGDAHTIREILLGPDSPPELPTEVPITFADSSITVLKDTHGKTSHLGAADIEAIAAYLRSLQK